jgi:S-adenosylmethionine hydrolase
MSATPPIALLTDFGTSDGYVGAMKGVVLGIAPDAPLVDLTHEIPPGQRSVSPARAQRDLPRA